MSQAPIRYLVDVGGRQYEVTVGERTDALVVDGEPFDLDLARVDETLYSALVGHRSVTLDIAPDDEAGRFLVDDGRRIHDVSVRSEREAARAAAAARRAPGSDGGVVQASMPGIVTQLLVAKGDVVQADQPLLILEAMKMENEIRAGAAGRVARVHVTVGQSVTKGDTLVAVEPGLDEESG